MRPPARPAGRCAPRTGTRLLLGAAVAALGLLAAAASGDLPWRPAPGRGAPAGAPATAAPGPGPTAGPAADLTPGEPAADPGAARDPGRLEGAGEPAAPASPPPVDVAIRTIEPAGAPEPLRTALVAAAGEPGAWYWRNGDQLYVLLLLGRTPTAGYRVSVSGAVRRGGRLTVTAYGEPPAGAAAAVISYPAVVLAVDDPDRSVTEVEAVLDGRAWVAEAAG